MLRQWKLDEEFVFAALHADSFNRQPEGGCVVDLAQVSQLQLLSVAPSSQSPNLGEAPAVKHLGLSLDESGESIALLSDARHEITKVRAALVI